jgi:multiple sugar transport system substrate-binding protein
VKENAMNIGRLLLSLTAGWAIVAGPAVSGCAPDTAGAAGARGPINFASGKDTSYRGQARGMVDEWNRRHPDQKVTVLDMSVSSDDQRAQLAAHAQDAAAATGAARAAACYDVVSLDIVRTAEFARWGYIEPLDPGYVKPKEFLRQPIEGVRYRGKMWALPIRSDVGLLFYRKDILDAAGARPPRSWAELRQEAMIIAPKYGLQGYVGQFDQYEGFTVNALESIWDAGGDVLRDDGKIMIGSPGTRVGVGRLVQGFREGWIPQAAAQYNEEGSLTAFEKGHALFLRNWTYAYLRLLNDKDSAVAGRFGVTALPMPSALGGWNIALSHCSARRATALDFMRFLTGEQSQRTAFTRVAFAPSRRAPYEDPALLRLYPYLSVVRESIERARNRPVTPYYDQVTSAIQARLHGALTGSSTLDPDLADLARDLSDTVHNGN